MPRIVDYASLVQGILDFGHRATLSPYVDYFIQGAQEQIVNDILANNFGQGIRLMEAPYAPTEILANGTAPVPTDWIAPKIFTLSFSDDQFDLIFKDPQWLYSRYPLRGGDGIPAYIARDSYNPNGAPSGFAPWTSFTANGGQTVFPLTNGASVAFVSVNGVVLTPMADYRVSGNNLILTNGANAGESILAQSVPAAFDAESQEFTATAAQTSFTLANPAGSFVLFVSLDGVILDSDGDYSIAGSTLTLSTGASAGQVLIVATSVLLTDAGEDEIFVGITGQTEFTLAAPAGSLILYAALDGVVLNPGDDYSINGANLSLSEEALAGQTLIVRYVSTGLISGTSVFVFGPFPNDTYTIQGTYYQKPPVLSSTNATNWLVLDAPTLLHCACMVEAGKFLKDAGMVEGWSQLYEGRLQSFLGLDTAERYGSGPLVINAA